ncbi:MAG: hypothetical protein HAW66_05605 [Shewanella sp.]|nr:hypothetical protein [Shewanella sp.]
MRWLLSLLLYSGIVFATPKTLSQITSNTFQDPMVTMRLVEKTQSGIISNFAIDIQDNDVRYLFSLINPKTNTITQLEYRALDGRLIKQNVSLYTPGQHSKIAAIRFIFKNNLSFSELVELAIKNNSVHLLRAELDHDLGISYLELKLIDNNGQYRLAFDVEKLRPLPLLKWY